MKLMFWRRRRDTRDTFFDVLDEHGRRKARAVINDDGSYRLKHGEVPFELLEEAGAGCFAAVGLEPPQTPSDPGDPTLQLTAGAPIGPGAIDDPEAYEKAKAEGRIGELAPQPPND